MALARFVRPLGALAGVAAAFTLTAAASAQEAETEVGGGLTSFGVGDWLGLGLRLGLVIAIIWGAVVAMRWYVRRTGGGRHGRGTQALDIIETHALGPNRALHLVRLGDRAVLVGATPERITALLTVDDAEEVRRLASPPAEVERRPAAGSLATLVANLGSGMRAMNARREALRASTAAREGRRSPSTPRAEAPRQSLFDRTLANAEAAANTSAAGLRARTGYALAEEPAVAQRVDTRSARIADLQRAIEAARRNAS